MSHPPPPPRPSRQSIAAGSGGAAANTPTATGSGGSGGSTPHPMRPVELSVSAAFQPPPPADWIAVWKLEAFAMAIGADSVAPFNANSPHHTINSLPSHNAKDGNKELVLNAPVNTLMQDAMRLFSRCITAVAERRSEWKAIGGSNPDIKVKDLARVWNESYELSRQWPYRTRNADLTHNYLQHLVPRLNVMRSGDFLVIPSGWLTADEKKKEVEKEYNDCLLVVLEKRTNDSYSVWVVNGNTSIADINRSGLGYHPCRAGGAGPASAAVDANDARLQYKLTVIVDDVPASKIVDSSFWFVLIKMSVWSSKRHHARLLYEHLLPYLNAQPLQRYRTLHHNTLHSVSCTHFLVWCCVFDSNLLLNVDEKDDTTEYYPRPREGERYHFRILFEALYVMARRAGFNKAQAKLLHVLVRWELSRLVAEDVVRVKTVTASDIGLIRLCNQRLASDAADVAKLGLAAAPSSSPTVLTPPLLAEIKATIDGIEKHLRQLSTPTLHIAKLPPQLTIDAKAKFIPYPLFDRFRNEDSVEVCSMLLPAVWLPAS